MYSLNTMQVSSRRHQALCCPIAKVEFTCRSSHQNYCNVHDLRLMLTFWLPDQSLHFILQHAHAKANTGPHLARDDAMPF
jgi:hypothetical protein